MDSAKPPTNLNNFITRLLAKIPKISLEEAAEGLSSTSFNKRAKRMPATVFEDLLKVEDDGDDNEYNNYSSGEYGLYNDERKDLDYTAYSLKYSYYGYCDY